MICDCSIASLLHIFLLLVANVFRPSSRTLPGSIVFTLAIVFKTSVGERESLTERIFFPLHKAAIWQKTKQELSVEFLKDSNIKIDIHSLGIAASVKNYDNTVFLYFFLSFFLSFNTHFFINSLDSFYIFLSFSPFFFLLMHI